MNPHGNDVVPVREAPVPRRLGPVRLFSQPHHRDTQDQMVLGCESGGEGVMTQISAVLRGEF